VDAGRGFTPLVNFSAQPEPFLTPRPHQTTQRTPRKELTLSRKVEECEALDAAVQRRQHPRVPRQVRQRPVLRHGLTLVHVSAQLEPCLTHKSTLHTLNTLYHPLDTGYTTPTRSPYPTKSA